MAVEGVNNNSSNAGLYAGSGVVIGAGAGVGTAYLTKPYLKNGAPTDEFIRKAADNLIDAAPNVTDEQKTFLREVGPYFEKLEKVSDAEAYKQLTSSMFDSATKAYQNIDALKSALKGGGEFSAFVIGGKAEDEAAKIIEAVEQAKSVDEIKQILQQITEDSLKTKGFETVKNEAMALRNTLKLAGIPISVEELGKISIDSVLENGKLTNDSKGLTAEGFNLVKKAARSIQGKYALIYGICAGAALGVVGYLAGVMGGNKADDAVAQPASSNAEE